VTSAGRVVTLGERLGPSAPLELDGAPLVPASSANTRGTAIDGVGEAEILVWHKPRGVTTTHADPYAAITLPQALTEELGAARAERMLSIGRLDRETEGLLLLTPERSLVARLAHPRARLRRGYAVATRFSLGEPEFSRLRAGIRLTDGWARALESRAVQPADSLPAEIRSGNDDPGQWSYIALGEGRHHEVRRLYGAVGHPVLRLVRLSFGPATLGELLPGALRPLTSDERSEFSRALNAPPQAPA